MPPPQHFDPLSWNGTSRSVCGEPSLVEVPTPPEISWPRGADYTTDFEPRGSHVKCVSAGRRVARTPLGGVRGSSLCVSRVAHQALAGFSLERKSAIVSAARDGQGAG